MDVPYVNIHTHRRTGTGVEVVSRMALSGEEPLPPRSVGIHPWQVGEVDTEAALAEVSTAPADFIGEIGLDYAVEGDRQLQAEVFRAQLAIAVERGLPVIVHCVRAFEPVMKILADYTLRAVVFHGFVGSPEQAARAVKRGYYLSFGERSLGSPKTVEAMRSVPLVQMFLESDESPLAIAEIYSRAAEILALPLPRLKEQLYMNYVVINSYLEKCPG
jgi:TatD DNase family protein